MHLPFALALLLPASAQEEQREIRIASRTFRPKFRIPGEAPGRVKPVELWVRRNRGEWNRATEAGVSVQWGEFDGTWLHSTTTVPSDGSYEFWPQVGDAVSNTSPPPGPGDRPAARFLVETFVQVAPPQWISPRAGEEFRPGDTVTLRWSVPDRGFRARSVTVTAAVDGGADQVVVRNAGLEDSTAWPAPAGNRCRFRLAVLAQTGEEKTADLDIRIRAPESVALPQWIAPRAGEELRVGDPIALAWAVPTRGYRPHSVSIEFSVDGQPLASLAQGLALDGTHPWRVPSGKTLRLRLAAVEESGRVQETQTELLRLKVETPVDLAGPEFLQPRRDDAVPADTTIILNWRPRGKGLQPDSVMIYWSLDDEGEHLIAKGLPLEGRREWKTPNRPGGKLTLKILALDSTGKQSFGQVLRELRLLPSLEADLRWLRPGEPGTWSGGESVQLQWTSLRSNVRAGSVSLSFSLDNAPWTLITKGLEPAGFYLWTVPWQATENLRLKVAGVTQGGTPVEAVSASVGVRAAERPNIAHARRHADSARIHAARSQTAQAAEEYEKSLAIWPDYPEALNDLGVVYARERQSAKALEYFLRAKKASPSHPGPYVNAASMELDLGLRDDALADLRDAVELGLDREARLSLQAADRLLRLANAYLDAREDAKSDECCRLILKVRLADRATRDRAQKHLDRAKQP